MANISRSNRHATATSFGPNTNTRVAVATIGQPVNLGLLFESAYPRFSAPCREFDSPGLAVVAIEQLTGACVGFVRIAATVNRHAVAIVGRHDRCDLVLSSDDCVALRHLAIVVQPVVDWKAGSSTVEYRVLDLRTQNGFRDEHGRALRGLRCDGAAAIQVGGYLLLLLPTGDQTDWPVSAADAWNCIPERIYFDEMTASAATPRAQRVVNARHTRATITRGPNLAADSPIDDVAGQLELVGLKERRTILLGARALHDGVLLGRYTRCDSTMEDDGTMSRVHALLLQVGAQLLLIDTASSNGIAVKSALVKLHTLTAYTEFLVGDATTAHWTWLS